MEKMISVKKWFWAWQDDEEEAWLREMANHGFHLTNIKIGGYTFKVGDPADIIYRIDYKITPNGDMNEYLELFTATGWEYVKGINGWQYFRIAASEGGMDEIHTEKESKMRRYMEITGIMMGLLAFPWIAIVSVNSPGSPGWFRIGATLVFSLIMLFYIYVMIRLALRMRQIKKS